MATEQEYRNAISRVASGNGSDKDIALTQNMAKVAGSFGGLAREALKNAGKK